MEITPIFRPATEADLAGVLVLYESAKQEPFSVWNEDYPTAVDATHDLETDNLYVLEEDGRVIGTLSVCPENEMDGFSHLFAYHAPGVREIARIAVVADRHGRGYAALMVSRICEILAARGVPALRISVAKGNLPARRTYPRVGFSEAGEAQMYGGDYVLMEKTL